MSLRMIVSVRTIVMPMSWMTMQYLRHHKIAHQSDDRGPKHYKSVDLDFIDVDNPPNCLVNQHAGQSPNDHDVNKGADDPGSVVAKGEA